MTNPDRVIKLEDVEELVVMLRKLLRVVDQTVRELSVQSESLVGLQDELSLVKVQSQISSIVEKLEFVIHDLTYLCR